MSNQLDWSRYSRWTWIIALLALLPLLWMWMSGRGPNSGNCCGAPVAAVAAAPAVPAAAAVATAAATAVAAATPAPAATPVAAAAVATPAEPVKAAEPPPPKVEEPKVEAKPVPTVPKANKRGKRPPKQDRN